MAFDDSAERKIYFYRAFPMDGSDNFSLDRKSVCDAIDALPGSDEFYLEEAGGKVTCGEVVRSRAPQQVKLYAIRRTDLPSQDDGTGQITDLDLAAEAGLAEAVHIGLYPNSVIAAEFFYYGPRISRLESFLNARCGQDVHLRPFLQKDIIDAALSRCDDFRSFRFKIASEPDAQKAAADLGFQETVDQAKGLHASVYADVTLRAEAQDARFTNGVRGLLEKIKDGNRRKIFSNLEVSGHTANGVESFNLLSEHLVRKALIPKESARTRALDSPAAFKAIQAAYDDVKDQLSDDYIGE